KQKEEYLHEMELYNQKKEEEAEILRLEEDEQMKIHKQEALRGKIFKGTGARAHFIVFRHLFPLILDYV
ncbi:hypothetical protein MKW98_021512, partial [Papaver atlanticum]